MLEAFYPIERSTTSENVISEVQLRIVNKMVIKRRCYICPRSKDRKYRTTCHLCKVNNCTTNSTSTLFVSTVLRILARSRLNSSIIRAYMKKYLKSQTTNRQAKKLSFLYPWFERSRSFLLNHKC